MTGLYCVNLNLIFSNICNSLRKMPVYKSKTIFSLQVVYMFYNPTDSGAVQLKADNLDMTLGNVKQVLNAFNAVFRTVAIKAMGRLNALNIVLSAAQLRNKFTNVLRGVALFFWARDGKQT